MITPASTAAAFAHGAALHIKSEDNPSYYEDQWPFRILWFEHEIEARHGHQNLWAALAGLNWAFHQRDVVTVHDTLTAAAKYARVMASDDAIADAARAMNLDPKCAIRHADAWSVAKAAERIGTVAPSYGWLRNIALEACATNQKESMSALKRIRAAKAMAFVDGAFTRERDAVLLDADERGWPPTWTDSFLEKMWFWYGERGRWWAMEGAVWRNEIDDAQKTVGDLLVEAANFAGLRVSKESIDRLVQKLGMTPNMPLNHATRADLILAANKMAAPDSP